MSLTEMLEQLQTLTPEERQQLIDRAIEIDEEALTPELQKLIESRLAEHDANPSSASPADEVIARVKALLDK